MNGTEREALCARIDELCAENEKLRKAKDTMRGDAFEIGAMLVKERDENEKLRELVKDLYDVAEFSIGYFGDTYDIRKRMDALGIEVDG